MNDSKDYAPLVIIGGGAAGLMAACQAGEQGMRVLLVERKHRVGSKLLMCGNGRCNLTSRMEATQMLVDFGAPLDVFLRPALELFPPTLQMRWFERRGLPLMQTSDGKVFPRSERAPDVVHCFQDQLREQNVALCTQSPVDRVEPLEGGGFMVRMPAFSVAAQQVLITTGGVSYPKTGSVGDGQRMAVELGHKVQPFRPGLVGIDWAGEWLQRHAGEQFKQAVVRVFDGAIRLGETRGLLECERWGLGGGCISNATRLLSRRQAKAPILEIQPSPDARPFRIDPAMARPLKEAMVTVGGVDLGSVRAETMESTLHPGLFFAGEVLDIDGPTGGYNLTAAFATATLAVKEMVRRGGERGERVEGRGSRVEGRGKIAGYRLQTADRRPPPTGRWSKDNDGRRTSGVGRPGYEGRGSRVEGRGPRREGRGERA